MKRIIRGLIVALFGSGLIYLGVALGRPGWLPPWARIDTDDFPAWARLGELRRKTVDEDEDRARQEKPAGSEDGDEPFRVVRLASAELAHRIGIETTPVVKERHAHSLTCNAETAYDARR